MAQQPAPWKRGLKWTGLAFLIFLGFFYLNMYRQGGPNRGATGFLVLVCLGGAYFLWRSLSREEDALDEQETGQDWLVQTQHATIDLAMEHGGVLTVTDVSTDLNIVMADAEHVLRSLEDGIRVVSTVTPDGVIVYEFREVMHRLARRGQAGTPPHAG